jgi:C4-dicarboxylate-specific signal transduction histidine kinase
MRFLPRRASISESASKRSARSGDFLGSSSGWPGVVSLDRSPLWRYGLTLCFVALALTASLLLQKLFPYPFLFLFFAAVMASAWFGGTAAGLFAVVSCTIGVDYFFVPPAHSLAINATDSAYFLGFIACALVASWVSSTRRKDDVALREARDQLERKVAERTADLERSNAELLRTMRDHDEAQQTLRQSQAELARLARALTMGELTSSIAHEINQPLTAVVSHGHACAGWLSSDPPDLPRARQTIASIIRDGTRAGEVLKRIRALVSKQTDAGSLVDMNEVILELTVFFRDEAMRRQVQLRTEFAQGLPLIPGDRVQLQQVVLNLMMNALDAMQASQRAAREIVVRTTPDRQPGIVVSVEDTGVGLSPETAAKIFDPFFTTKPQGIGMGLSISRSIVEAHRGRLWVDSRLGGGSIFQFRLPLEQESKNE